MAMVLHSFTTKFKQFGSAKILENIYRKRKASDSENDSGYGACNDVNLALHLFSANSEHNFPNMSDRASHENYDEDDEDIGEEDEEAEIHHSIETVIERLLGGVLDDASVGHVYPSFPEYEKIFAEFHTQLASTVRNLSLALQRALHNIPNDEDVTPTTAHAALKRLIAALVIECQALPYLQIPENEESMSTDSLTLTNVDIFSSYEGLVASAIINKVIEDNQAKYVKDNDAVSSIDMLETRKRNSVANVSGDLENDETATDSFTEAELPLQCVQIEEIEEITREYTDSEDDNFSNMSHQSAGLQSIDLLAMQRNGSESDLLCAFDQENEGRIAFPEFGSDLVEDFAKKEDMPTCYLTVVTSWKENWLFQRKKRLPLNCSMKYQLMTYFDEAPCMLIPCPSEDTSAIDFDELSSELSESHSVGSIEFSSEDETQKSDEISKHRSIEVAVQTKTVVGKHMHPLQFLVPNQSDNVKSFLHEEQKISVADNSLIHHQEMFKEDVTYYSKASDDVNTMVSNTCVDSGAKESKVLHEASFCDAALFYAGRNEVESIANDDEVTSHCSGKSKECHENMLVMDSHAPGDIFLIPTQPGTIAEREHKKWLNAVPLKNNPYSAENITKRFSNAHAKLHMGHASSFEEFEQKLKDSSHNTIKEPLQTKLNCGLRSIDGNLYKRDYYINDHQQNGYIKGDEKYKSISDFGCLGNESYESIPEETLNSLEEKVYVSAGKVFTLENHVKRLERELKDMSIAPTSSTSLQCYMEKAKNDTFKMAKEADVSSDNENLVMPCVRNLAVKFCSTVCEIEGNLIRERSVDKVEDAVKVKKTRPCMKVHSLTARSLSREFRDRAKQNLPKPMNRLFSVPVQASDDATSEQESLYSSTSAVSPACLPQSDVIHGYTSDESSTSTNSLPRPRTRQRIAHSILQRASYWERRAEQGLLSDASVNEEFPGLETAHYET